MKVLFVTNFCTHFTVRTFEELAKALDVRFLFYSDGGETYWETANEKHQGDFEFRYLPGFYVTSRVRVVPALVKEILDSNADIVVMALGGRFALPVTYMCARLTRKRFVLWSGLWYHPRSFFHRLSWPLLQHIYRASDAIIVYGMHVKEFLVEHGVNPERVFPFWHSVDVETMGRDVDQHAVAGYRAAWCPNGDPIILYVGRLDPVKSLDTLILAVDQLRRHRRCRLVIVGRGPEAPALETLSKALGLEVIFADYIANDKLPEVYAAADVFCLPSKTMPMVKEAWGLVINEAMLQRCIPVASDAVGAAVGGLFDAELLSLVFPEQDVTALEAGLSRALDYSRDEAMRERVRKRALQFSPQNQARGLIAVVEQLERDQEIARAQSKKPSSLRRARP